MPFANFKVPAGTLTAEQKELIVHRATDLYAVSFGLDAFHAVAVAGSPMIQTWPPNYEQAGAVKSGEVEMGPLACVLKNTKAAGVLRTITVQ